MAPTRNVLVEVLDERIRQDMRWGQQNHPDGTSTARWAGNADFTRETCQKMAAGGHVTWLHILAEEVAEAFAEEHPARLRAELIQVSAVAAAWIEAIDRRAVAQRAEDVLPAGYTSPVSAS